MKKKVFQDGASGAGRLISWKDMKMISRCALAAKPVALALLGLAAICSPTFATTSVQNASDCGAGTHPMQITVKTGDLKGAGTDSNIGLSIQGTAPHSNPPRPEYPPDYKGDKQVFTLNQMLSGNAFERNDTDVIVFCANDLYALYLENVWQITMTSDGKYAGSDWYPEYVEIKWISWDPKQGSRVQRCDVGEWLDGGSVTKTCKLIRVDWP